jgi:protein-S-isoprenylcysteine O-methyltransferase Ste14
LHDGLFRWRGSLLLLPAVLALLSSRPGAGTLPAALPWLAAGLALRAWSFSWLGGQGRTRDPGPPAVRVIGGPYALFEHPVYLANVAVALGLLIAAAPPGWLAAALALGLVAFYGALAAREGAQLAGLPTRGQPVAGLARVARTERSTWAVVALFCLLAAV